MATVTASAGAKHALDAASRASFVSLEHARIPGNINKMSAPSGWKGRKEDWTKS
jgi:hypothetical protein